jgi:prepilin peptidase CpaA
MNTTYAVAVLIGFVACITDLRSRRIPNVLTFGGTAAALVFHTMGSGGEGLLQASGGWIVGAAMLFFPFALGGLGAGDVKLLAALGAWLGPRDAAWVGLYAGIVGGALAIIVALLHGYLEQALSNVWLLLAHWRASGIRQLHEVSFAGNRGPRLAYAVPIFVGVIVAIWQH